MSPCKQTSQRYLSDAATFAGMAADALQHAKAVGLSGEVEVAAAKLQDGQRGAQRLLRTLTAEEARGARLRDLDAAGDA